MCPGPVKAFVLFEFHLEGITREKFLLPNYMVRTMLILTQVQ